MRAWRYLLAGVFLFVLLGCDSSEKTINGRDSQQPSAQDPSVEAQPLSNRGVGIVKGESDSRQYEYLQLDNRLQVVLISDPNTVKAAASLDVGIGSADDPKEREGLAHFLEHMLFLGTEKYPEPDAYQTFISEQGGSHNAYTSPEHTNYFFDVKASALPEALDRFSQFFTAPLFSEEYSDRERNAVHSEYKAKLKDSYRRQRDVFREIAHKEHPMSQFTVGNLETLSNTQAQPIRKDLLSFYERFYSSDRMTLVVLGKESLEELQQMVRPLFSAVPLREAEARVAGKKLFEKDDLPLVVNIKTEKQEQRLELLFPVESVVGLYRKKPLEYIGNLLGHEGEGSLFATLKQQGWAEALSAGGNADGRNQGSFRVAIKLTEEGYRHQQQVVMTTLAMIERIKSDGVEAWRFEEQKKLADIGFRFAEKGQPIHTVSRISRHLHDFPAEDVLRGVFAFDEFDGGLIQQYLEAMSLSNMVMVVSSPQEDTDRESALYATPYRVSSLDTVGWSVNDELTAMLGLPRINPFVPEALGIVARDGVVHDELSSAAPEAIVLNDQSKVWYQQDQEFLVPKANFMARIKTPQVGDSVESVAKSHLYAALINDQLNAFSYPAMLAGLHFDFSANTKGFDLSVGGYSGRQDELLKQLLNTATAANFSEARFNSLRTELVKGWRNTRELTPYRQVFRRIPAALYAPFWADMELAAALESVSYEQLKSFSESLWAGSKITQLSHGNVSRSQSIELAELLTKKLVAPNEEKSLQPSKVVNLDAAITHHDHLVVDHNDVMAAYYLQSPDDSIESQMISGLLQQSLKSSFFHQLRTEQQLGYIVFVSDMTFKNIGASVFVVQSPSASLETVTSSITEFIQGVSLEEDAFERYKLAFLEKLREPPKNLNEQSGRLWAQLLDEDWEFDDRELMIKAVSALTFEKFQQRVSDRLNSPQAMWFSAGRLPFEMPNAQQVEVSLGTFKSSQEAFVFP